MRRRVSLGLMKRTDLVRQLELCPSTQEVFVSYRGRKLLIERVASVGKNGSVWVGIVVKAPPSKGQQSCGGKKE